MGDIRNPNVLIQIRKVDDLLKSSGVRNFCLDCIKSSKGGCCHGCSLLGPNGCTNKPLSCAFWLCDDAKRKFPEVVGVLYKETQKWPYGVARAYRHASLEEEQKCQDAFGSAL